jgi:hypothetical protein
MLFKNILSNDFLIRDKYMVNAHSQIHICKSKEIIKLNFKNVDVSKGRV